DGAEQADRVVPATLPQRAVEPAEESDRVVVPRPAQVVGELAQRFEGSRKRGGDDVGMNRSHAASAPSRRPPPSRPPDALQSSDRAGRLASKDRGGGYRGVVR